MKSGHPANRFAVACLDGLFEDNDLGGLARDDLVALCDLVNQVLSFGDRHYDGCDRKERATWQQLFIYNMSQN